MIKKILIVLILLPVIGVAGGWLYLRQLQPDYDERTTLPGLNDGVEVYYDRFAIPHIYAQNEPDVFRALGYVHAKERLWQMELLRRIAPGRLSELFGEATLETDKFFKTIGIDRYSAECVGRLEEQGGQVRENTLAYLDGINRFVEEGPTPIEFTILGVDKTPFTPSDVFNIIGYMSFSFAMAHKTEPVLTAVLQKHGPSYLADLMLKVDTNSTIIYSHTAELLSLKINRLLNGLPVPPLIGSNSWVVSGQKTKSGKVLFANDPHIGFSQPAVWYEAHIETPGLKLYGYWLGGYPFPMLAHSPHHAVGLTMFENDDIDFFREKLHPDDPGQYQYKGKWLPCQQRREVINVKDGEPVHLTIRSTVHGPLVNEAIGALPDSAPVSMWWIYLEHPGRTLEATYRLCKAKNMAEARAAASLIHAPGLNVMYGDAAGNIAWWACAKLPIRPAHVNSKLLLDGTTGLDDPSGYYDFSENPQAENPPQGYVYSANNQSRSPSGVLHPGYYLPEDRARRIVRLLEEKNDWTVEDFKKMLNDVTSENVPEIVASLAAAIDLGRLSANEKAVLDQLTRWNGSFTLPAVGPTIYNKLLYHIVHDLFADEMGEQLFDVFNGTHIMKRSIQPLFANASSAWWDDLSTPDVKESRTDIVTGALKKSVEELSAQFGTDLSQWQWQKVHTLTHNHSFSAVASLKNYFNVGPFSVPGNNETINNMIYKLQPDGTYEVFAGPSTRRIIDFADVQNNCWSILPTGQSGNVMSTHYNDQANLYARGGFRKQWMNRDTIREKAKYHSVFSPGN